MSQNIKPHQAVSLIMAIERVQTPAKCTKCTIGTAVTGKSYHQLFAKSNGLKSNQSLMLKKSLLLGTFLLGCSISLQAQTLRNDMISAIGGNFTIPNAKLIIHQSIGQSSVIGVFSNSPLTLSQGYLRGTQVLSKEVLPPFEVIPFPNAFADQITFRFVTDHEEETIFRIYDMNGKKVYDQIMLPIKNEVLLDLDFLANGVYLAVLRSGNKVIQKRIIKNK